MDEYTVGEVARLSHVSVRTLHHCDEIGLLPPSGRSDAGHRLYSDADLQRLGRILFYRELEFPLEEIARILADPDAGDETEMEARKMGMSLTPEEQFEVFGTDAHVRHEAEAERRWGDTPAYRESQRRAAPAAMDAAEAHRVHITRWFYACDHAMHRRLAELYVADARFTATYDAVAPGLARFVHDAIVANADRAGSDPA